MIHGIHSLGMRSRNTKELSERLEMLGFVPAIEGPRLGHGDEWSAMFLTQSGALAAVPSASPSRLDERDVGQTGWCDLLLHGDQEDVDRILALPGGSSVSGLLRPTAFMFDSLLGTTIGVTAADVPLAPESSLLRIESVPWAVDSGREAASTFGRATGLRAAEEWSGLEFPDLGTRNTLVFTGKRSYVDFNEPTRADAPLAKSLRRGGPGAYAVVLEPIDFENYVKRLGEVGVPLATPEPIDLRVCWRDGSEGVAARIVMVERTYVEGLRIFISDPTFPW